MRTSFQLRIGILLALLVAETALVISLRTLGWIGTGGTIRWISCLLVAVLPLTLAAVALCFQRFRFSLRILLIATALVAVFMCATVLPLQNALNARRGSQSLLAVGATLRTESSFEEVYQRLQYDPRPRQPGPVAAEHLVGWLRPLASKSLSVTPDDFVKEIWFNSDPQVAEFCCVAPHFRNVERVSIESASPVAMEQLRVTLPQLPRLTDIQLNGSSPPKDWLRSFQNVTTLDMNGGISGGAPLSKETLHEIAAMPNLRVLWIFKYSVTDDEVKILGESKTLKRLILRYTAVTDAGEKELLNALPGCTIHRE